MVKDKKSFSLTLSVMSVFFVSMALGGITPAIAKIMQAYPDIPPATITYIMTLPSLIGIPASIIVGMLAGKRVKFKTLTIVCILIFVLGGIAPTFFPGFTALLITRAIFGIGMGGLMVLGNPLVTGFYSKDQRAKILGMGTFASFGGAMIMQYVGGFLADANWSYVFLTYGLALISLVMVIFFLPEPNLSDATEAMEVKKGKVPPKAIFLSVLFAIGCMLITPMLFNSSVLAMKMSTLSTIAATVSVFYSIGCLIGGISFGKFYQIAGRYTPSVSMFIAAAGVAGVAYSSNIIMMCAAIAVAGIGFSSAIPAFMMSIGFITPKESVAFATSVFMAAMGFGSFLTTPWMTFIANTTGDPVVAPVVAGFIGLAVLGVGFLFINFYPKTAAVAAEVI